jgi:hypothetical protein
LGKERVPNDLNPPFKEKEKGAEGKSPLGGQWKEKEKEKVPIAWWPMESEGKTPFHLFPLSP